MLDFSIKFCFPGGDDFAFEISLDNNFNLKSLKLKVHKCIIFSYVSFIFYTMKAFNVF